MNKEEIINYLMENPEIREYMIKILEPFLLIVMDLFCMIITIMEPVAKIINNAIEEYMNEVYEK